MLPAFGPGALFVQRNDIANQTPVNIGKANEFSLDFAATGKDLFGQGQYPLIHARGTGKVTAKAKAALISGIAFNSVFFGLTLAAGEHVVALSESHTIPTTPYTVTIAPPGSGTFVADLGVISASSGLLAPGLPLTVVTTTPSVSGTYEVNPATGVYTFDSADTGKTVLITYTYALAAVGQNLSISNPLIGTTPTFAAWYYTAVSQPGGAVPLTIELYACAADKLNMQFKLEDFMLPEFDFACFVNSAGLIGQLNYGEVS